MTYLLSTAQLTDQPITDFTEVRGLLVALQTNQELEFVVVASSEDKVHYIQTYYLEDGVYLVEMSESKTHYRDQSASLEQVITSFEQYYAGEGLGSALNWQDVSSQYNKSQH